MRREERERERGKKSRKNSCGGERSASVRRGWDALAKRKWSTRGGGGTKIMSAARTKNHGDRESRRKGDELSNLKFHARERWRKKHSALVGFLSIVEKSGTPMGNSISANSIVVYIRNECLSARSGSEKISLSRASERQKIHEVI